MVGGGVVGDFGVGVATDWTRTNGIGQRSAAAAACVVVVTITTGRLIEAKTILVGSDSISSGYMSIESVESDTVRSTCCWHIPGTRCAAKSHSMDP